MAKACGAEFCEKHLSSHQILYVEITTTTVTFKLNTESIGFGVVII